MSLPNLISGARLLLAPVLVGLAWAGLPLVFLAGLGLALVSDWADGWFARRSKSKSALGARLDSAADFATYLVLALGSWWLWPEHLRGEAPATPSWSATAASTPTPTPRCCEETSCSTPSSAASRTTLVGAVDLAGWTAVGGEPRACRETS